MTRVKICGLHSAEDVAIVRDLQPDFAGFICSPGFRRSVTKENILAWTKNFPANIKKVGVFVNEEPETVANYACEGVVDFVQLHGHEDAEYVWMLRNFLERADHPVNIIQAIAVKTEADVKRLEESEVDYVLLDSGRGTGKKFDWSLVQKMRRPFFLAGGITPDNVIEAVDTFHPYAVDVSSGVETDGKKDREKVQRLIAAVRQAR